MQVKPGDRVTIHGLTGRPELNGKQAVLVGPGQNERVRVKMDSGEEVSLKQANLGIQAPGGGMPEGGMPGGGMPGGGMPGGMPGGFPGMPGGFPGMPPGGLPAMLEQIVDAVKQRLAAVGIKLPANMSPGKLGIGAALAAFAFYWIASRYFSMYVLALVGLAAYWGTQTAAGRKMLSTGAGHASRVLGRPLPPYLPLCALCIVVAITGQMIIGKSAGSLSSGGGGSTALSPDDLFAKAVREAYQQGFDDGTGGKDPRPPKHMPSPYAADADRSSRQSSSSGGFGFGSLMKYGMAGFYIYNLGKTPGGWNPQLAMANLKANPMMAIMLLSSCSGMLF